VQGAKHIDHRRHAPRAGLEDGGGVQGRPLEAHLLERGDTRHNSSMVHIEALVGRSNKTPRDLLAQERRGVLYSVWTGSMRCRARGVNMHHSVVHPSEKRYNVAI